jgi:ABC-type uncharacterized transport system substrate-binding protein
MARKRKAKATKSKTTARKNKLNIMPMTREVGFLIATSPSDWVRYINTFKQALNTPQVHITFVPPGGAKGDPQTIAQAAAHLAITSEVIVTAGTGAALACKGATQTTPIVFASVGDPAISGLIPQPGGNFTGGSNQQVTAVGQRVDCMLNSPQPKQFQEIFAVVGNYNNEPSRSAMTAAFNTLLAKGKQAQLAPINPGQNVDNFVTGLANQGVKSLYVCSDLYLTAQQSTALNHAAHQHLMLTMFEFEEHCTVHGGDLWCGVDFNDLFVEAAGYVDRLLGNPAIRAGDLPIFTTPIYCPSQLRSRRRR